MKLQLLAVGRLRRGPEKALVDEYLDRFAKTGRATGLPSIIVTEVDVKGGMQAEAEALSRAVLSGSALVVLDERGRALTSPDLARKLSAWRDEARDVSLVIGGADGLAPSLRDRADLAISFGAMVWPHMLVRVMLAEQLYRAASILAGTPYHRA
ncbi:MAG: 23S rRNA (pseudouridine(1915)-N(3))-methyltransferase RlmH [Pseudomonadota bacterium]